MVGTRTSLPSASARDDVPDSKKARAALRKLDIDGNRRLKCEEPQHEEFETYHWRGAVYAVSKDTKPEWVEQEPERYKRRKAEAENAAKETRRRDSGVGRSVSEEVAPAWSEGKRRRRRVRFEEAEKGGRKRKRSTRTSTDHEDEEQPRRRKKRKNMDRSGASPSPPPPARSRQTVAAPGPVVAPLHKRIPQLPRHLAAQPSLLTTTTPKDTSSSSPLNDTESPSDTPSNPHHTLENLRSTQRNLVELARQNTQHEKLMLQMKKFLLLQHLRQLRRERSEGDGETIAGAEDLKSKPSKSVASSSTAGVALSSVSPIARPIRLGEPAAFLLNDRLIDSERAESQIFSAVRARARDREGRSSRKRRANREVQAVRGWDLLTPPETQAGDEESEEGVVDGGEGGGKRAPEDEGLSDERKGRLGLLTESERDQIRGEWLGMWSPPRPDRQGEE